jgi:hypothetical protein
VPKHRSLRLVTALLLVLIAIDLAAIHTCALDVDAMSGPPGTSVAPLDPLGGSAHQHAVLHPDHCFCHGLSMGADASPLADPLNSACAVPDAPPGHLLKASAALYHPPQLPA